MRLNRITRVLAALTCLIAVAPLRALDPGREVSQYGRRSWDRENGLPHSAVLAVAQTRDGYIWAGTEYGLARLDGTRSVLFTRNNVPQLGKGYVFSLVADPDGSLWIGTSGSGLVRHHQGRFEVVEAVALAGALQVFALDIQSDGTLWMGTSVGVVRRTTQGVITVFPVDPPSTTGAVRAILADAGGRVLAGTSEGLSELRAGVVRPIRMASGAPRSVHEIVRDRAGTIWIGTNSGLCRLAGDRVRPVEASISPGSTHVEAIYEDSHGSLWVGTADGLKRITAGRVESFSAADGLTGTVIRALHEDRQATLWVGSYGGLTQLRDTPFAPLSRKQALEDPSVIAVAQDRDGAIWFGAASGLGRLLHGRMRWYGSDSGIAKGIVLTVTPAERGVWAGTYGGGLCLVAGDDGIKCYDRKDGIAGDIVAAALSDSDGGVWIALLSGGLQYFKDGRLSTYGVANGLSNLPIVGLAHARSGGVWLSLVRGGVVRFANGRVVESLPLAPDKAFVSVRSVLEDPDGTVWIASSDHGFLRWRGGVLTRYHLERLGFTTEAQQVVDDGVGSLWITSMNGIARIRKSDLHAYADNRSAAIALQRFDTSSGLPSDECAGGSVGAIRAADGTLWFGTAKGAVSIDPRLRPKHHPAPAVLIESLRADNLDVLPGQGVRPSTSRITFRYASPNFVDPDKTRFRYKLEGFDKTWVDAGASRTVEYTNIPPGNYTFRVATGSRPGAAAAFPFKRLPAFHETSIFQAACVAVLVLAILAGVKLRVRSLKRREQFLMERVAEQTVQLREADAHKQLILNSTGDGILEIDEAGTVTFANAAASRMLDGTAEQLVGRPIHHLVHDVMEQAPDPATSCPICHHFRVVRENRSAVFFTLTGHEVPVEYSSTCIVRDDPSSPHLVITFRDITERMAIEETKKQLVSTVSHELRTPLASIRGALGLLSAGKLGTVNEKGQRILDTAVLNTDRLVRLINDMLDLERIDAGRMELSRTIVDATDLLTQSIEGIQAAADEAGVRIVTECDARELFVDADRIIQTLTNLMGNAIKFSRPDGTVFVKGSLVGEEFLFRVADEGRGIPRDKLESIFDRFSQVDPSDSRLKGGTGLGLAISRSIIDAHGGRIQATSDGVRGSVFEFVIPGVTELRSHHQQG